MRGEPFPTSLSAAGPEEPVVVENNLASAPLLTASLLLLSSYPLSSETGCPCPAPSAATPPAPVELDGFGATGEASDGLTAAAELPKKLLLKRPKPLKANALFPVSDADTDTGDGVATGREDVGFAAWKKECF